jgi:hypothetical protein
VIVARALGLHPPSPTALTLPTLLLVALGTGAVAALINNLPASVWAASLLAAGPLAYAAAIGLAVGALAAPKARWAGCSRSRAGLRSCSQGRPSPARERLRTPRNRSVGRACKRQN